MSKNSDNPDADLYSILNKLEDFRDFEGKFQFKLCYPELSAKCNEWIQTSNPAIETTITGFVPISLEFTLNGAGKPWAGLGRSLSLWTRPLMTDSPSANNWFCAIGSPSYWPKSPFIPAWKEQGAAKVELFVKSNGRFSKYAS